MSLVITSYRTEQAVVCRYGQGHQEEEPGPMSEETKSPEATEQNGEEAQCRIAPGRGPRGANN
jgi:hypothetical protein